MYKQKAHSAHSSSDPLHVCRANTKAHSLLNPTTVLRVSSRYPANSTTFSQAYEDDGGPSRLEVSGSPKIFVSVNGVIGSTGGR
jgi:hypothetical protein